MAGKMICSPERCIIPPITIIPLIALVTLINGVCNEGETFQITMYPIKQARINTVTWEMNSEEPPNPIRATKTKAESQPIIFNNDHFFFSTSGNSDIFLETVSSFTGATVFF